MAHNMPTYRNILCRSLAALILVGIYFVSIVGTSALVLGASTTSALARGRGGGGFRGGGGRGFGRGGGVVVRGGRGRGWGYGRGLGGGCYWSPRWGRTICPY